MSQPSAACRLRRTKIVATLGPASNSPDVIRQMIAAGMDVARLNFSHGSHDDHARTIAVLRRIARAMDTPVTILQDLQGPKIRVGEVQGGELSLGTGEHWTLAPQDLAEAGPFTIPIDYPSLADEAETGMPVLLADGLLALEVAEVRSRGVRCRVVEGGLLRSRQGVNFPTLDLRLPALTEKDRRDVAFGLSQQVDWISLSFVRCAQDVRSLKTLLSSAGARQCVIAKIEKPQAVERLSEILEEADGLMVARGDLGVEMSPEQVPMLQKRIIEACNRRGTPVITATQMLESMIREPRPTRAEAADVANAIIDGTDAVMLSGESAVGAYPVKSVEMMARIATEVEERIEFKTYPSIGDDPTQALSEAANVIEKLVHPKLAAVLTTTGFTARMVAAERPRAPVIALTADPLVYHRLNLFWGVRPVLAPGEVETFEQLIGLAESTLLSRGLAEPGDTVLIVGGIPSRQPRGSNFIKVHQIGEVRGGNT